MKILAIGRNYTEHIKELNNEIPDEPVIFFKPDSALLVNNKPLYYPEFTRDLHYEVELVLKICKHGRHIDARFARNYYKEIAIGVDFTARDVQQKAKEKGLPWTLAKGFDGSAPVSQFLSIEQFEDLNNINFSLSIDGVVRQRGNTGMMIHSFDQIIAYISQFITLKKGDLIFTGTPQGVGPVQIGNTLEAHIENEKLLEVEIK